VLYLPAIVNGQAAPAGRVRLTFDAADETQPALSPDGRTVVYVRSEGGQTDIYGLSLTSGATARLTDTPLADEETPVFSPDGAWIAFASNRTGDWDIYRMRSDGAGAVPVVAQAGTDEQHPAFTPNGMRLLFSHSATGGGDLYIAWPGSASAAWTRLTMHPAADRFPTMSADGRQIAFRSERDGNSEIYIMDGDGAHPRRLTSEPAFDGYPVIAPDGSGASFVSQRGGVRGVYLVNAGAAVAWLEGDLAFEADTPRISPDGEWLLYAGRAPGGDYDIYRRPFASPLVRIGERGDELPGERCDWETGTLAYGWVHAWRATGDVRYLAWTRQWIDGCIAQRPPIEHVNDGLPGYAALAVYAEEGGAARRAFAEQVADYLLHVAPRTADGTLAHEGDTVWDDTLLSVVPFLVEMGRISGDTSYTDEAARQVMLHAAHLQDGGTGLYHHAWDESENAYLGPSYWGRGNGWALLADVEVLKALPAAHPARAQIMEAMRRQATGLRPLQDSGGLWHTVVTRPDFYLETSGTALIGYGLLQGVHAGWLTDAGDARAAHAALGGVWKAVAADGTVNGVSAPTGPMRNEEWYDGIPHDAPQRYGQGVALLIGSPLGD
jgi:unsaturated rhamnogalacturonyl hydrolase